MFNWINGIQALVIAAIVFFFYRAFIKNTASEKLVHGLFGLGALWLLSYFMGWVRLNLLADFLHWTALFLSVGLIVIFQPELRKFLALMGNVRVLHGMLGAAFRSGGNKEQSEKSLDEIIGAVEYMSAKKTGGLIVFQDRLDDGVIEKKGIKIDARISAELLLTIFFNKTPLHDGAVIIEGNRIAYAGAILPLSQNNLNWKYGTRHRAAIGLSEASKSVVLVVSEETGDISIAEAGEIKKIDDMKKLKAKLAKIIR